LIGKQRNILKKRKAPLSIHEVYKGNQTRASKKKTKEKTQKQQRNQDPKPKPAKNTLDYIAPIVILPLIEHSKFLTSLLSLVLRTKAGSS
jgi:hypothetical protein